MGVVLLSRESNVVSLCALSRLRCSTVKASGYWGKRVDKEDRSHDSMFVSAQFICPSV